MRTVIATQKGFYRGRRIYPGDKFNIPDELELSWATDPESYEEPPEKTEEEEAKKAVEALRGNREADDKHPPVKESKASKKTSKKTSKATKKTKKK